MDFNLFSIFVNRYPASKGIPSFLVEKQDKYINNFAFPYKASFLLEMYTGALETLPPKVFA